MTTLFNQNSEKSKRQQLRHNTTTPEQRLWRYLRDRQLHGVRFRRQHSIGRYIVDFYSPETKLVIEIDGDSHFTVEAKKYDAVRDEYMAALGLTILRFTNQEVMNNLEGVIQKISETLVRLRPPLTPPS